MSFRPGRLSCGDPTRCNNCFWAYPEGCLHTLSEAERNSSEMNQIMDVFERYTEWVESRSSGGRSTSEGVHFWDRPENRRFVNRDLVRFVYFMIFKFVTLKEKMSKNWKANAKTYLFDGVIRLTGAAICGSIKEGDRAFNAPFRDDSNAADGLNHEHVMALDKTQRRYSYAANAIDDLCLECTCGYAGLLLVIEQVAPCHCLRAEIHKETKDMLFTCSCCLLQEEYPEQFGNAICGNCRIARYCSKECQKEHWFQCEGGHKKVCKGIQKLLQLDF